LWELPVALPMYSEQQRIADCLTSLDELIAYENKKLDIFKSHKKGLMQKLFTTEGKTVPEWRFSEFRNSGEWEEKLLDKIGTIITGSTPSTAEADNYDGDIMFVSPADISDAKLVVKTKTTLTEKGFSKTRRIPAYSVMFVCIASIGKIAQNKYECATNQQINAVVPFEGYINDFVYYILEHNANNVAQLAGKQTVPIINKTLFSSIKLSIPKDEREQQKIADCLSAIDDKITAQIEKNEALKQHKKGLMQGLFPSAQEVME